MGKCLILSQYHHSASVSAARGVGTELEKKEEGRLRGENRGDIGGETEQRDFPSRRA